MRTYSKQRQAMLGLSPERHMEKVDRMLTLVDQAVKRSGDALDAKDCDVAIDEYAYASTVYGRAAAHAASARGPGRSVRELEQRVRDREIWLRRLGDRIGKSCRWKG